MRRYGERCGLAKDAVRKHKWEVFGRFSQPQQVGLEGFAKCVAFVKASLYERCN
jgi:hypothetical protein